MITFGPVPSRRLGRSLGINNIPDKICTYSCVYCQLGRTRKLSVERKRFYPPEIMMKKVMRKVERTIQAGESIDYLTFVPNGEPTLDISLGHEIDLALRLNLKVAVITNGSLIWRNDVRENLMKADLVSLKIDTIMENVWYRINRPHGSLRLDNILRGLKLLSKEFQGELITESMIVEGLNDDTDELKRLADYIARLNVSKSYIAVPIRPPAEKWVRPPKEVRVMNAYQLFKHRIGNVECLLGNEGNQFTSTDDVAEDLLSITAVHPMREEAVRKLIIEARKDWSTIEHLLSEKKLVEAEYHGEKFYIKNIWNL